MITVTIDPNDSPDEIIIPAYTKFTSSLDNVNYTFTTNEDYTVILDSGVYSKEIEIYEGTVLTYTFVVDDSIRNRYTLENPNLDTDSIVVKVRENSSTTDSTIYTQFNNIVDLDSESTVYFVEENVDGNYEIFFGDGILGKKLENGNILTITARFCNGEEANGINNFKAVGVVGYNKEIPTTTYPPSSIVVISDAENGQERQDSDSIKYLAPKYFGMQNRLVTKDDFKSYILHNYSDVEAISVWGGDENDPPYFGKVIMSLKPKDGFSISLIRRQEIIEALNPKTIMSIDPLIVDPTFTFMRPTVKVDYDSRLTALTFSQLYNKISTAIKDYEKDTLGVFNNGFYMSKFAAKIDNIDNSIKNTKVDLLLEKRILPIINSSISYKLSFNSKIYHPYDGYLGALSSNGFSVAGYADSMFFDDDGYGNIRMFYPTNNSKTYVNTKAGTINYNTGQILINSTIFIGVSDGSDEISIYVQPDETLYSPIRNEILLLSYPKISIYDIQLQTIMLTQVVDVDGNATPIPQSNINIPVILS